VASRMAVINGKDPASCASPRINKHGWHKKHEEFTRNSQAEVCLMGDSIVDGLSRYPKVWKKYFCGSMKAVNFGIGDRTQHVLWRAEKGEIPSQVCGHSLWYKQY